MKQIVLLCNMGMSTSALMNRMKKHAEATGFECVISAHPVTECEEHKDADCILIGPQIAYQMDQVKKKMPGMPVDVISMQDYGMMNAPKVLEQARKLMHC